MEKGRTEELKVVALEPDGLIHVLEETTRSSDEDVHPSKTIHLVLEVLSSDNETSGERVIRTDLSKDFEDLDGL